MSENATSNRSVSPRQFSKGLSRQKGADPNAASQGASQVHTGVDQNPVLSAQFDHRGRIGTASVSIIVLRYFHGQPRSRREVIWPSCVSKLQRYFIAHVRAVNEKSKAVRDIYAAAICFQFGGRLAVEEASWFGGQRDSNQTEGEIGQGISAAIGQLPMEDRRRGKCSQCENPIAAIHDIREFETRVDA